MSGLSISDDLRNAISLSTKSDLSKKSKYSTIVATVKAGGLRPSKNSHNSMRVKKVKAGGGLSKDSYNPADAGRQCASWVEILHPLLRIQNDGRLGKYRRTLKSMTAGGQAKQIRKKKLEGGRVSRGAGDLARGKHPHPVRCAGRPSPGSGEGTPASRRLLLADAPRSGDGDVAAAFMPLLRESHSFVSRVATAGN
jgi:hypothetical protein